MKNRYSNAELIDNVPYCKCGKPAGRICDYFGAKVYDNGFTGFIRRCSDKKCNILSIYYVDATLDENRRYLFNIKDVEIIKEK